MPFKAGDRVAVIRKKMPSLKGTVVDSRWNAYLVEIDGQDVPPKWIPEGRLEALDD